MDFFKKHEISRPSRPFNERDFNSRIPSYNDDSDYTTNAPSYYDDLARKNKLLKTLSFRIWEYQEVINKQFNEWDEEIKKRFLAWDKNLEEFDDEVLRLLQEWLEDGTLDHIINDTIFSWKADKTYVDDELYKKFDKEGFFVNIKDFGAVGDGVTDDTVAIQKAFDSGRPLLVPEGVFIAKDLKLNNPVKITGVGENFSVLRLHPDSNKSLISKKTDDYFGGFHAENMTFDDNGVVNNRVTREDNLMFFYNAYPLKFHKVSFVNIAHGVLMECGEGHVGGDVKHGITFDECYFTAHPDLFENFDDVAAINVNRAMNDGVITNCLFENLSSTAIRIFPYGVEPDEIAPQRWTIRDSTIRNMSKKRIQDGLFGGDGIYYRGDDLLIENVHIHGIRQTPIGVQGINNQKTTAKNIRIINNVIDSGNDYAKERHDSVILLRNVDAIVDNNNIICDYEHTASKGLILKWGGSLIMSNNSIKNARRDSMEIRSSSHESFPTKIGNVVITGNHMEYFSTSDRAAILVSISDKHDGPFVISDNAVRGAVLKINNFENETGKITKLIAHGNITNSGNYFMLNDDDLQHISMYSISGQNEDKSTVLTNIGNRLIQGQITLYGKGSNIRLLVNEELPSPYDSKNRGKILLVEEENEERLYICLKGSDDVPRWKRLDIE